MIDYIKFFGYAFVKGIRRAPRDLVLLILLWLPRLWELICDLCRAIRNRRAHGGRRFNADDCCVRLPPNTLVRPDPLIYSQYYLMAQGLAVTWDNPDIEIYQTVGALPPQLVPSHMLTQGTEYEVRVRVWNGSYEGPAPGLPVHLSFLTFGINTVSEPIGAVAINLPVKGAPNHPAIVPFKWKTPDAPGHYCLQARLEWPDDANPDNNLGQENLDVGVFQSPALFEFPVRNDRRYVRRFNLTVDSYQLPALLPCDAYRPRRGGRAPRTRLQESQDRWKVARAVHARDAFPIPPGWGVEIMPGDVMEFGPLEERLVTVRITAPEGFTGRRAFNVNAFEGDLIIGGVTLFVETK
jgi:hypothetical protein